MEGFGLWSSTAGLRPEVPGSHCDVPEHPPAVFSFPHLENNILKNKIVFEKSSQTTYVKYLSYLTLNAN